MDYSYIPQTQKVAEERPVYAVKPLCTKCGSNDTFALMNMPVSPRQCYKCKNTFSNPILGYKSYLVEKQVN